MKSGSIQIKGRNGLACARVNRKDDWQCFTDLEQGLQALSENTSVVHIGRTMEGDERKAFRQPIHLLSLGYGQEPDQRIDHYVSHIVNLSWRDSFTPQVNVCILAMGKQKIGELVGNEPIYFLWHCSI